MPLCHICLAFLTKIIYHVIMTFLRQSITILLSIGLAMFIKSLFSNAIVAILGILFIIYIILQNRKKIENFNLFILTTLVLIFVSSTGEISSPLFFLLYFLSFVIAFVFDPKVVFVFTIGVIILLFPGALKTDLTPNLILLFFLFLLSPLAFFTGIAYQKNQENKRRIEDMKKKAQAIDNDIEDVLYDNRQKLDAQAAEKLSEAVLKRRS